jgi:hypothetical protein
MSLQDDVRALDQACYDLLLADAPRGMDRARIADLANGVAPYTQREVEENNIVVNVNDLTHTRLCHDARAQFGNAFLKTGNFFTCRTDMGPKHKRSLYGSIVTREIARRMKRSIPYFERERANIGLLMLHGISPACWENEDKWCPKPLGVEDVLIPGRTLLGFDNLPMFVLRRSFTDIELKRLTQGSKVDPGWNQPFVEGCLKWIDEQSMTLYGNIWPDYWSPEKWSERAKEDGGSVTSDQVPKLDTFDCYIYDDTGDTTGWVRRIILDNWSNPTISPTRVMIDRNKRGALDQTAASQFLYNSGNRKIGGSWQNIVAFQFADLSAVFPARYHSVRSLGWLMYSTCHLKNRVACKFYEAVLEALMPYFKVNSADEMQRALQLQLVTRGFIDDSIKPVPANERWQVNTGLVELGQNRLDQTTKELSSSYVQNQNYSQDKTDKTKFQVMAELNATTALVSAGLNQSYQYKSFEDRELFRRFMRVNSSDPDVRDCRAAILRQGVPEEALNPEYWDIEHERVSGGGNKTMEMTIAAQLMEWRDKFDPQPQRQILRDAVLAITDDAGKSLALVPEEPEKVTPATHDAQQSVGSLMALEDLEPVTGENHIEVVETLLRTLANRVEEVMKAGGMTDAKTLSGFQNIAKYIGKHVAIIAQDQEEKGRVKHYTDILGKLMNLIKGFAQRLQEAMQKQQQAQQQGGGMDPKDAAKVQATVAGARAKMQLAKESHAQKTAQRAIAFEEKQRQEAEKHRAEIAAVDLATAAEIRRGQMRSLSEGENAS